MEPISVEQLLSVQKRKLQILLIFFISMKNITSSINTYQRWNILTLCHSIELRNIFVITAESTLKSGQNFIFQ